MNSPEIEQIDQQNLHTNRIVPVYPLTANITQRWLRRLMYRVVTHWAPRLDDPLPQNLCQEDGLIDYSTAIHQVHFPDSMKQLEASRHRLAYEEIFFLQLGMLNQKQNWRKRQARVFETPLDWINAQKAALPFQLTSALGGNSLRSCQRTSDEPFIAR
jgi:ATP-dependent DNA helicase RecG